MEDAPTLMKLPKSECLDIWIQKQRRKWPKTWKNIEEPVISLERNLYGHSTAGLQGREREFEKVLLENLCKKAPTWECLFVHRQQSLSLSVYVDDIKMAGKKHNLAPMRNILMKHVDLEKATTLLDQEWLGCANANVNRTQISSTSAEMFGSRIFARATEKLLVSENVVETLLRGPTKWTDMRRNAWNGTANWQTKASCS